jgi:MscS family membrane protein
MPVPALLPPRFPIPIAGLLLAVAVWVALQLIGTRLRRDSLARALLMRSRLSLCLTILLASVGWWVATLIGTELLPLPRGGLEVRDGLIVIGLVWTVLRCKGELLRRVDTYSKQVFPNLPERDRLFLFDLADKLIAILVAVIVTLELLRLLGTPTALLATAGGFGAAALGFGAKTIVENALSGISLYINRPFVVGDVIRIPSEELTGTVVQIGWFYTQLRDPERQPVFIPNGLFTTQPVINIARIDNRRIWIDFGVRYEDRPVLEAIINALQHQLAADPAIDHDKTLAVHFVGYGESSLQLRLLCHASDGDMATAWDLQQRLLLQIGRVVEEHGAQMPAPLHSLLKT